jgi:hypothetical protein
MLMAKNIDPKLKKIEDYLKISDNSFVIPEYQRAYSWKIENCDKLWQDILNFMDEDNKDNYFFGTIIISCQDEDEKLCLIDGQQRTTSFLLLLKALLLRINKEITDLLSQKDDDSVQLFNALRQRRISLMSILYGVEPESVLDNPKKDSKLDKDYVILTNQSINEREDYKKELDIIIKADNYDDAEKNVIKIPYARKDNKYTSYFRNFKYFYEKCEKLSQIELNLFAKSFLNKCEVIEIRSWQIEQAITMFNSLNSDGLPLYDSDIISAKLYASAEKSGKSDNYTKKWKQLLDIIHDLKGANVITIDSILMQKMYYERAIHKEILTDNGSINVTTPGLRRYYTELNKSILNEPILLCDSLIRLAKIWDKVIGYPIVKVLLKYNDNSKLFLASYLYRFNVNEIDESKVYKIVECFLRLFALLEIVDIGFSSRFFKTFLFGESLKLVDDNIKEDIIIEDFNNHINNNWDIETIKESICSYDGNVLIYLNEFLHAKECNIKLNLDSKYDIEHIMPYSGSNLLEIQKDAKINGTDEFKGLVNKIGNKILLEERINRAIGNEWFRTKVSTKLKDKTGYIDSYYPIARTLVDTYNGTDKAYWTKEDILEATNKSSERIAKFIFKV